MTRFIRAAPLAVSKLTNDNPVKIDSKVQSL